QVFGLKGNDTITISDSNGPMPSSNLFGGEGDDILTGSNSPDVLDGGPGNDTLIGKGGDDRLLGGPGNDVLNGGQGVDEMFGGDGDDQIIWNPGDGSDLVEGEAGNNTLVFNGANISETVDIQANGPRLRFFRNVGNIVMDCAGIEHVLFRAFGGSDLINVNDLAGTEVTEVAIDLAGTTAADGVKDSVVVNGTDADDHIIVTGNTNSVTVAGLAAKVTVLNAEPAIDELVINGLAGADTIDASAVEAGAIDLTLNGGPGDDILIGGAGDDVLNGQQGVDQMFGNAGDDVFIWNPGDANDLIEGGAGNDTLIFNGANIAEEVEISANGPRVRFTRNIASITMDCNQVETIEFAARGGADKITVNNLAGTGVTAVNLNLAQSADSNAGDNAVDTVIVNATSGDDVVIVSDGVLVAGLPAAVHIEGAEATDQLIVQLLDGNDVLNADGLNAGSITLTVDGGKGDDLIIGGSGNDFLFGGEGDDILIGGPGQDALDGGPGANVLIQDN
ncbi:MAG TPA: calcium-binding protein, partial [Verrucomicrobiae bacterium]